MLPQPAAACAPIVDRFEFVTIDRGHQVGDLFRRRLVKHLMIREPRLQGTSDRADRGRGLLACARKQRHLLAAST